MVVPVAQRPEEEEGEEEGEGGCEAEERLRRRAALDEARLPKRVEGRGGGQRDGGRRELKVGGGRRAGEGQRDGGTRAEERNRTSPGDWGRGAWDGAREMCISPRRSAAES